MSYVLADVYAGLYEEFLAYAKERVSTQGYKTLSGNVKRFLMWLESEDILPEEVSIQDAVRYKTYVSEKRNREGKEISIGGIHNYLKTARMIYRYLLQKESVSANPFEAVAYPRLPEYISRNVLTESQMHCLLEKMSKYYEKETSMKKLRAYRCHVLAEFLYATGLRIAEAASLVESNLDLEHRFVYVPQGKGGKPRTAFLNTYSAEIMKVYLQKGRSYFLTIFNRSEEPRLFGADASRLSIVLNEQLRTVCTELEIPVITSHGFRHSLGTHLLHNGCDMRYIQVILGHESLGSTQIYTKVYKDDLKESLDAYHPRKYKTEEKQ